MTCYPSPLFTIALLIVIAVGFIGEWALLAYVLDAIHEDFNIEEDRNGST
jgi:hypothetical protein